MTKKHTLAAAAALALALAVPPAIAQPSPGVTIYGIVDAGLSHTTGYAGGSRSDLVSGIMEGTRLGARGNEDLGGGFRALFTIEQRIELDSGTLSSRPPSGSQLPDRASTATLMGLPAALQLAVSAVAANIGATVGVNLGNGAWDRQSYVGLVTPVGAILAGRQYTPAYETVATFETLGTQSSLSAGQISAIPAAIDIRANNALQYRIVQGPITAGLMYALGESAVSTDASRLIGAQVSYRTDAFGVGIGYNTRNNEAGQKSLTSLVLGARLRAGPGDANVMFAKYKDDNPTGLSSIAGLLTPQVGAGAATLVQDAFIEAFKQDSRQYQIGYKLSSGAHTVYVAYNKLDDRRPADADVQSYGVAYTYALSKRTDLNAVLTQFDNSGLAQAAPGQAGFLGGVTAAAGKDSTNVAVGIRHRF